MCESFSSSPSGKKVEERPEGQRMDFESVFRILGRKKDEPLDQQLSYHLNTSQEADILPSPFSYVSPRKRAQRTLELLDLGCRDRMPWHTATSSPPEQPSLNVKTNAKVQITEDIREWDYGDYEGKTSKQIRQERGEKGEGAWDIWRDGCPGGE